MSNKEVSKGKLSPAQARAVKLWDNPDVMPSSPDGGRAEVPANKRTASQVSDPHFGADVDDRRPAPPDTEELEKWNRFKE